MRNIPDKAFFDGGAPSLENLNASGMTYWDEIRNNSATRNKVNEWLNLLFDQKGYNLHVESYIKPKDVYDCALKYFDSFNYSGDEEVFAQFDVKDAAGKFLKI